MGNTLRGDLAIGMNTGAAKKVRQVNVYEKVSLITANQGEEFTKENQWVAKLKREMKITAPKRVEPTTLSRMKIRARV